MPRDRKDQPRREEEVPENVSVPPERNAAGTTEADGYDQPEASTQKIPHRQDDQDDVQ